MKKHQENLINQELIQKLGLSPIEKYEKFDKFPVTIFFNIALAVLTVIQVNYFTSTRNLNNSNQYASWNQLIYGSISDNNVYNYFTLNDIQKQIQQIFTNLNTPYSSLLNQYIIEGKTKAKLVFYKKFPTGHQNQKYSYDIDLQNGIEQPFNMNNSKSLKEWIQSIDNFYIYFEQIGIIDYQNVQSQWNLMINYKVQHSYTIDSYLSVNGYQISMGSNGSTHMQQEFDEVLCINIIISILSFICIIKLLLRINNIIQLYMENRNISKRNLLLSNKNQNQKNQINQLFQNQKSWNELTLREKWSFFDLWFLYNLFGHFIQLFTSISIISIHFSAIIPQSLDVEISIFFSWGIGLSSFFAITSLAQYLQYNPQINLIIDMIIKSFPRIIVEAFGFIPIVMAYIVLGLSLFSNSERYSDINNSIITSFSLLLGDSIHDITIDLMANGSTQQNSSLPSSFAIIFVFTFVFTFMLAVQNIWIAIIMEELDIKSQEIQEKKKLQKQKTLLQRKLSITRNLGTGGIIKIEEEDQNEESNAFKRVESLNQNQYEIQFDEQNNLQSDYNFSSGNQDDFQEDLSFKIQDSSQKLQKTKTAPLGLVSRQPVILQKQNTLQRQETKETQQLMSENFMLKKKLSVQAINQVAKKLSVSGQNIDNNNLIYSKQKIKQIFKHEQDQIEQKIQVLEQINSLTQEIKFLVDQCCQDHKDMQIYNLNKDEKKNINSSYKSILSLVNRKSVQLLSKINRIL